MFEIEKDDDRTYRINFKIADDADEKDYVLAVEVLGDNTFKEGADLITLSVEGNCFKEVIDEVVSIASADISAVVGESTSIDIQVLNTGNVESTYTVELTGAGSWADSVLPQTFSLAGGQSDSVSLNLVPKEDLEEGTYTATLNVKRGNEVVKTQQISVTYEKPENFLSGITDTLGGSTLWVIIDIILILLVILVVVKIFTRKRKDE